MSEMSWLGPRWARPWQVVEITNRPGMPESVRVLSAHGTKRRAKVCAFAHNVLIVMAHVEFFKWVEVRPTPNRGDLLGGVNGDL